MKLVPLGLAACLLAAPVAAQQAPILDSSDEEAGWSTDADGISNRSGLHCPASVWQGLGDKAPTRFDTDPAFGIALDGTCQYYTYFNRGESNETRLVITLLKTDQPREYILAWDKGPFEFDPPVGAVVERGADTYLSGRWRIDIGHFMTLIAREHGNQSIIVMTVVPENYSDETVWTIVDGLFAANP